MTQYQEYPKVRTIITPKGRMKIVVKIAAGNRTHVFYPANPSPAYPYEAWLPEFILELLPDYQRQIYGGRIN